MRRVRMTLILGWLTILVLTAAVGAPSAAARTAGKTALSARETRAILALMRAHAHGRRLRGYRISPRARSSIVNGTGAVQGTWGFMAFVVHFDASDNPDFWCSGTLIAPNVVLTAAHCATDEASGQPLDPSGYQVVTGAVDIEDTTNRQISHVDRVVVDPAYDLQSHAADAALLVLSTPSTAPTIRIARPGETLPYTPGRDALIGGWGIPYANGDASSLLQVAPTNVQGVDYCTQFWDGFDAVATWDTCAAQLPALSTATCNGDSGGPLLTADALGDAVEIGVTSVGPADCSTTRADYFARTDVISPWVGGVLVDLNGGTTSSSTTSSSSSSSSSTDTTTTVTTTTTSTSTTTTTTTRTTQPVVSPPPVGIAKVTPPPLTMAEVRSYAATMVHARTHKRPRLALSCRRRNAWNVRCSIHWHSAGASFAVSGSFFHYLSGTRAYWWYAFTGTRRWTTCRVRHHQRSCTAYVQHFRWA